MMTNDMMLAGISVAGAKALAKLLDGRRAPCRCRSEDQEVRSLLGRLTARPRSVAPADGCACGRTCC